MIQRLRTEKLVSLVQKAQKGDRFAYSQIVKQFQDLAVGYAYSILRNFPEAEEVAQEAFIEAYLNLSRLRQPAAFGGWLKKIVFKHCDRATRKKRPFFVSLTKTEELIASQPNPLSIAEVRELQAKIGQAIELLPETERQVITLFYLSDRSQKEISAFLEIPVSTIKNRLHSARKRLKRQVIQMVEDYLDHQRPSQRDTFANRVTQMIGAARSGDRQNIKALLKEDIRLANIQDDDIQVTPLHCAVHRGYLDTAKLLIDAGADVNAEEGNYSKSTPLHWAATGGHLEVTKFLVENGAKISVKDNWYNLTPLGWATVIKLAPPNCPIFKQHRAITKYLLDAGAQLDIFSAISLQQKESVVSLIEANPAILNQRLGFVLDELQPLQFAIEKNRIEIVKLLLDKGADVRGENRFGITPLCLATKGNKKQIIKFLRAKNAPLDLATAIITEQWQQAQALLDRQPNLVAKKSLLLHYTIQHGLRKATSWSIEKGADINIRAKYELDDYVASLTPLHVAIRAEKIEMAQILLDYGADPNAKTRGEIEVTALHGAVYIGNLNLIRLLVEYQAELTAQDRNGLTPLDYAQKFDRQAAFKLLKKL